MSFRTPSRQRSSWLVLLLCATVGALALASVWNDSATIDEPAHIVNGLVKLHHGAIAFYSAQPPLSAAIVALPVSLAGYAPPAHWQREGSPWRLGRELLYRSRHDPHSILTLARCASIALLVALVFAIYIFVLRMTQNFVAAFASAAMAGFCPVLLAHGRLATVDISTTYFLFAAAALFLALLRAPSMPLALLCGAATACAIASKTSGAIIVPFFLVLVLLRARKGLPWRALIVAGVASVITFAIVYFALGSSNPFREWLRAAEGIRRLYAEGYTRPQFLLGEFSATGWKHYYLVAIAVKSSLASLIAFVVAIVIAVRRRSFELIACLLFAALFVGIASFSALDIGVRHILPAYPFLFGAFGIAIADMKRGDVLAAVLLVAQILTAALAFPSYLSYFNPLIGSPRNADRVLIDSNLDWGQDLARLGDWMHDNNVQSIRIHYFGIADIQQELGPHAERWIAPRAQPLPNGWFAVSRHFYRLSFRPGSRMNYDDYLRQSRAKYVTTIGGSIDLYRVD